MRFRTSARSPRPRGDATAARCFVLGTILALLAAACGTPAPPTPRQPDSRTAAAAITEDGLRERLEALATATAGSEQYRAVGSAGYDRAATLVEQELRAAGWTVSDDAYTGAAFADEGGSFLEVGGRTFGVDDLRPLVFAPAGDVEGRVITIDWDPDTIERTGKGCAVTHYGDLPA
ncbi:MAG: hypothetical protein ABIG85_06465, partial [Chloroflexota bacterium]